MFKTVFAVSVGLFCLPGLASDLKLTPPALIADGVLLAQSDDDEYADDESGDESDGYESDESDAAASDESDATSSRGTTGGRWLDFEGARPQGRNFGVGAQFGVPTGATVKYWFSDTTAVVGGLGGPGPFLGGFMLHGDFLFHTPTLLNKPGFNLSFYGGPGLYMTFGIAGIIGYPGLGTAPFLLPFGLGLRAPMGVSFAIKQKYVPMEVYGELTVNLGLVPVLTAIPMATVGARWYFDM